MTVNGKSWPFFEVQPRRYRFRVVNGSNARFLRDAALRGGQDGLELQRDRHALHGSPAASGVPGPAIWQIGSDGGFLNAPTNVDDGASAPHLFSAPAERSDVIVDFTGQAGQRFILTNTAVAPFPNGGAVVGSLPPPALQGPTQREPERARAVRDRSIRSWSSASTSPCKGPTTRSIPPAITRRSVPRRSSTSSRATRTCRWTPIGSSCSTRWKTSTREPRSR